MSDQLRVLMLEDVEEDALLVLRELRAGGFEVIHERVETRNAFLQALQAGAWDLVLADYRLPAYSGLNALQDLRSTGKDLPFILVSGTIDPETAVGAMRAGAHDYLMKSDLNRLAPAVRRELREVEVRRQHRAAQVALEESRGRYRQLVENAREAIYVVQEGNIVFANAACAKLAGMAVAEIPGRSMFEFAPEQDHAALLDRHEKLLRGEGPEGAHELRFRPHGGGERWLSVNAVRIDWDGRPATLNLATDVTERRRSEAELRDSEARFRQLIDSMDNFAVQGYGADGTVHYWNRASELLYGYSREEALGRNLVELIIPTAMREQVREAIRKAAASGEMPPASPLELVRKDGTPAPVYSSHTIVRVAGREPEMFCLDVDLSDLKQAQGAMRRSEEILSRLFETSPAPIVVSTFPEGKILRANGAFLHIAGFSREEVIGRTIRELGLWEDPGVREAITRAIARGEQPPPIEIRARRKDGVGFDVMLAFAPFPIEGRLHILSVGVDITARKQAETILARTVDRYQQMLSQQHHGVLVTSENQRVEYVNERFCALLGIEGGGSSPGRHGCRGGHRPPPSLLCESSRDRGPHRGDRAVSMPRLRGGGSPEGRPTCPCRLHPPGGERRSQRAHVDPPRCHAGAGTPRPVVPVAETRHRRPTRRGHRPRLQQPPHGLWGMRQLAPQEASRRILPPPAGRGHPPSGREGDRDDPATPFPQSPAVGTTPPARPEPPSPGGPQDGEAPHPGTRGDHGSARGTTPLGRGGPQPDASGPDEPDRERPRRDAFGGATADRDGPP